MGRTACYGKGIWEEARGWLMDCGADPEDVEAWSDGYVKRLVERHHFDGWKGFLYHMG